jgi:hypothetical protein
VQKKVSEVTAQRDEYFQAKEEYQNKYHRLINPKIMCDAGMWPCIACTLNPE